MTKYKIMLVMLVVGLLALTWFEWRFQTLQISSEQIYEGNLRCTKTVSKNVYDGTEFTVFECATKNSNTYNPILTSIF